MYDLNTMLQMLQKAMQSPEFRQSMSSYGSNGVSGQTFSTPQMPLDPTFQMEGPGMPGGGGRSTTGNGGEGIGFDYPGSSSQTYDPRTASAGGRNTNYTGYGDLYQPKAGALPGQYTGQAQAGPTVQQMQSPGYQAGLPKNALVYQQAGPAGAFVQDYSQVKPLSGMFSPDNKSYSTGGDNGVTVGTDVLKGLHDNGTAWDDVNNAFMQNLGRGMTASDRSYYDGLLGSNGDPTSIINGIKGSSEAQTFAASGQPNQYQGYLDAYKKNADAGVYDWKAGS